MKRTKITLNKPNPLFELWLKEWENKAITEGSDLQYHFSKALDTLKKYPLPLESGKDCIILKHFGSKLCMMLDKKLEQHRQMHKKLAQSGNICTCTSCNYINMYSISNKKCKEIKKEEIARYKDKQLEEFNLKKNCLLPWTFSCYAVLISLYDKIENSNYSGYMYGTELLSESKQLYNIIFNILDPDLYDGKSSISTLIWNKLILLKEQPTRFCLTDKGIAITKKFNDILNMKNYDKYLLRLHFKKTKKSISTKHALSTPKGLGTKQFSSTMDSIICNTKSLTETSGNENISANIPYTFGTKIDIQNESKCKQIDINQKKVNTHNFDKEMNDLLKSSSNSAECLSNEIQKKITLKPYSFDIILLVDVQETCGGKTKPQHDATIVELTRFNVQFQTRHLNVGDFTWIAKCRHTNEELILPYIVERKRIDDLSSSIKSARFHEQKFRLKQSGIENLIYIIENHDRPTLPFSNLLQASVNTLVQDKFIVRYTNNHEDSMSYLSRLTRKISQIYKNKKLIECKKQNLITKDTINNFISLMKFDEFNKTASKIKNFNVTQMFIRQLLLIKGISVDKALAIVDHYSTPHLLIDALRKSQCAEQLLANISYGLQKRQIGQQISKLIHLYYTQKELH